MIRTLLKLIGAAFQDLWADLWTVLAINLFWLIAQVLIIPGPPATLALTSYANRIANGEPTDFSDMWKSFRSHWGPAWRWGILNLLVTALIISNIYVIDHFQVGSWKAYLQGTYVALLAVWLAVQFFGLPFLFEQEQMSIRQALRNGAVLIGRNLGFSLGLFFLMALIILLGTAAFLLSAMFGAVFLSIVANRAVLNRLQETGLLKEKE